MNRLLALAVLLGACASLTGCGASKGKTDAQTSGANAWTPGPDERFTIKIKTPGSAGSVERIAQTLTTTSSNKTSDATGKVVKDDSSPKENTSLTYVYVQTVLEKPDPHKPPTKVRRRYEKAEKKEGDKTTKMSFENETVLIEKKK